MWIMLQDGPRNLAWGLLLFRLKPFQLFMYRPQCLGAVINLGVKNVIAWSACVDNRWTERYVWELPYQLHYTELYRHDKKLDSDNDSEQLERSGSGQLRPHRSMIHWSLGHDLWLVWQYPRKRGIATKNRAKRLAHFGGITTRREESVNDVIERRRVS